MVWLKTAQDAGSLVWDHTFDRQNEMTKMVLQCRKSDRLHRGNEDRLGEKAA